MFKKRSLPSGFGGFNPSLVTFVKSDSSGTRNVVSSSVKDFRMFNPIDTVDYTLSEELRAGVPLKEVSSLVLNEFPDMSQEQILETLQQQEFKNE